MVEKPYKKVMKATDLGIFLGSGCSNNKFAGLDYDCWLRNTGKNEMRERVMLNLFDLQSTIMLKCQGGCPYITHHSQSETEIEK
jgi:hypothetical protein